MGKCYMCEKEAVSREHVPPKCLFPKAKDVEGDFDFRQNLMTVPSCEEHNSVKSNDDEYLMLVLSFTITSAGKGKSSQFAKIVRIIEKKSHTIRALFKNFKPVLVVDKEEKLTQTGAFEIDRPRFDSIIEHVARAIFYYEFGERFVGKLDQHCHFLLTDLHGKDASSKNAKLQKVSQISEKIVSGSEYRGSNPNIFRYKIQEIEGSKNIFLLMEFYEASKVSVNFSPS